MSLEVSLDICGGQERMGFSLHLAPSAVGHADAGEGLWLRGRAKTGAVVGLYPGIVYTRAHYRCTQLNILLPDCACH